MKLTTNLARLLFAILAGTSIAVHAQQETTLVDLSPISIPDGKSYTLAIVKKSIVTAAVRNQWRVDEESPDTIRLKLDGRKDGAVVVVDVVYDIKTYCIKYVSSEGLGYDKGNVVNQLNVAKSSASTPTLYSHYSNSDKKLEPNVQSWAAQTREPTIGPSYSRWINNLVKSINIELAIANL